MHVYLNGELTDPAEALLPIDDALCQHAVGLFETMSVFNGRAFRLREHLERLAVSAKALGLSRGLDTEALAQAVAQTISHNRLVEARLRLTVTAGQISLLRDDTPNPANNPKPTIFVEASERIVYDPAYFEKGVMVVIGPPAANPFDALAGHKTVSYWHRLVTLRSAASVGGGEVIWLNTSNHLASGAVSNLFLVKEGGLATPIARGEEVEGALPAPVLPGIMRGAVIQLAESLGLPVRRRMLSVADLLDADEVFLTNSSWLLLPVTSVEKKTIGDGRVGPVTQRVRESILKLVEAETNPS